jgi:hypothetical protein
VTPTYWCYLNQADKQEPANKCDSHRITVNTQPSLGVLQISGSATDASAAARAADNQAVNRENDNRAHN